MNTTTTESPRYVVGWNLCGYMPDSEPAEVEDFETAKRCLIDDLKRAEEDAESEEEAEDYCHAAEDVNLWSTPQTVIVRGCAYWIAEGVQ